MIVAIVIVAVLVAVVLGVVAFRVARRPRAAPSAPGEPAAVATKAPPARAEPAVAEPAVEEPVLQAPAPAEAVDEVVEKPRLRDRLGRTRAAFSGVFTGLRGHKIDDETWDDLEEAMLLADVGLVT